MNYKVLAAVLLLFVMGSAHSVEVSLSPIKTSVEPGQAVMYNVTVKNTEGTQTKYTVFMLNPSFQISTETFALAPNQNGTATLKLYVSNNTNIGNYFDTLYIAYNDKTYQSRIDYSVDVPSNKRVRVTSLFSPASFTPDSPFMINYSTVNYGVTRNVTLGISVFQDSYEVAAFSRQIPAPTGQDTQSLKFDFDPSVKPGDYLVRFTINFLGDTIYQDVRSLKISPYTSMSVRREVTKSVFGKTVNVTVTNAGTGPESSYVVKENLTLLESALLTTTSGAKRVSGGIEWDINTVPPSSTLEYDYSITYIPLLLLPFFISGAVFFVILWNRKVVVSKKVHGYSMKNGELEVSFRINVRNVSFRQLRNVVISEEVPSFVKSVHDFGHIKPEHFKGTRLHRLQWEMSTLKPGEEIIVSYKVKAPIEIIGRIAFPPTKVYVKDGSGTYMRKSNMIALETRSETLERLEK